MGETLFAPVSYGELIDKITILELKMRHIEDKEKSRNVRKELELLSEIWGKILGQEAEEVHAVSSALREINAKLWDVEDALREMEAKQQFGHEFIEAARSVYQLNDQRAKAKKQINIALGSPLIEEKSYA